MTRSIMIALVLLLVACDNDPEPMDAGGMDAGFDADILPPRVHEELPDPEGLTAGIAQVRIPAPVGIGLVGNAPFGLDPNPTPFSERFPGSRRSHGELTFRAVALSRGDAFEVVFVRTDTIGVYQHLRAAVLDELETRIGRNLHESLVIAANHTHSGPGRLLLTEGALENVGDTFFPEFYDGVVDALADVVEMALADRQPAELATFMTGTSEAHNDRRCENDPLPQLQESPDLPFIAVQRGGQLDAIIASYGYHGTVLGYDELTLSGDMGAVVEQRVEERFDHDVTVLFFNSWGADMSVGDRAEDPGATGPVQPGGYDRMHRVGDIIADVIVPSLVGLTYRADVDVRARTYRVPISREAIGYDFSTFNYPHGGAFCGLGTEGNCEMIERDEDLDRSCIRIGVREMLPKQTLITAGQIGDLYFVTGAGEWTTALANGVLDRVRELSGGEAMFIGYAQDYIGYNTGEDDWWQGGYEATGALWGPGQGDYLAARGREAFETFHDTWTEPPWRQPVRVEPFGGYEGYELYVPEAPVGLGTISTDVASSATTDDIVTFTVQGSDPWLGVPLVTLEASDGTEVVRSNGRPVESRSYDIWADLDVEPTYDAMLRSDTRTFSWTFSFPVSVRSGSSIPDLSGGSYRFRVSLPTDAAPMVVTTGTFTVP